MHSKSFLVFLLLVVFPICFYCCCKTELQIIGNGELKAFSLTQRIEIDTVKAPFALNNFCELEYANADFSIIGEAYALSCAEIYLNELVDSSFEITCNQDFAYDGNIINKFSDFSNLRTLNIQISSWDAYVSVQFPDDFIQNANFSKGVHEFQIKIMTTDSLLIENSIELFMDI